MTPKMMNSAPRSQSFQNRFEETARVIRALQHRSGGGFYFP